MRGWGKRGGSADMQGKGMRWGLVGASIGSTLWGKGGGGQKASTINGQRSTIIQSQLPLCNAQQISDCLCMHACLSMPCKLSSFYACMQGSVSWPAAAHCPYTFHPCSIFTSSARLNSHVVQATQMFWCVAAACGC